MQNLPDYYAILGVPPTASSDTIKAAYRSRMKQVHPDLADPNDPADRLRREAMAKQVNEAYSILSSPFRRRAYDRARTVGPRIGEARRTPPSSATPTPQPQTKRQRPPTFSEWAVRWLFYTIATRYDAILNLASVLLFSAIAVSPSLVRAIQHADTSQVTHYSTVLVVVMIPISFFFYGLRNIIEDRLVRLIGAEAAAGAMFVVLNSVFVWLLPYLSTPLSKLVGWLLGFVLVGGPQLIVFAIMRAGRDKSYQKMPFRPPVGPRFPTKAVISLGLLLAGVGLAMGIIYGLIQVGVSDNLVTLIGIAMLLIVSIGMTYYDNKHDI